MRRKAYIAALVVLVGSLIGTTYSSGLFSSIKHSNTEEVRGDHIKLYNHDTEFTIVEINGKQITFYDPILRDELEAHGIAIPPSDQERFGGKEVVFADDPLFADAFYSHYSKFVFDVEKYTWENV